MFRATVIQEYYLDEANKVIEPVRTFLDRHPIRYRCERVVGSATAEVVGSRQREKAQMILMGTHGRGLLVRVVMGSVAQHIAADCDVPVLLVK